MRETIWVLPNLVVILPFSVGIDLLPPMGLVPRLFPALMNAFWALSAQTASVSMQKRNQYLHDNICSINKAHPTYLLSIHQFWTLFWCANGAFWSINIYSNQQRFFRAQNGAREGATAQLQWPAPNADRFRHCWLLFTITANNQPLQELEIHGSAHRH